MARPTFEQLLKQKIVIFDGAGGTMFQQADLAADDYGGELYEGCHEYLNITRPSVVERIHREYLEAGSDLIETNTFGGTSIVLDEYDLGHMAREINFEAAQIARRAADEFSTPEKPRYVAGSMGPTTKSITVTGGVTFEALIDTYAEQVEALIDGGVDVLLLETCQDMRNVKAAYLGMDRVFRHKGHKLPLIVSGTIEPMGTTLAGQNIEAFYLSLEHMQPTMVGLNCATGPEFMRDHLRSLSSLAHTAVSCYPNAGLPDEEGNYHESPESLAQKVAAFAEKGWLNMVGGCCGTTPEHIRAMAEAVQPFSPRTIPERHAHAVSGIEPLIYDDSMRPILVGERTNVIGSRKFKRLIAEGKFEEASEIARAQVKNGAQVIDICLADPDRDELDDMQRFLEYVIHKVKVPLMIDSTDEEVLEKSLTYSQGKAIINSINLEDGEERFEKVVPLLKRYGAAVIVGTIDEQGMAVTAERKLEIAKRSYELLVNKYGLPPADIIFDTLVFPVGTGDEQYIGSAKATVDGIAMIKKEMPECPIALGVSNVSFGLPPVGREVVNAVYLYHCTKAGLDYAIVNTEKLERYASIPQKEIQLAERLLFETTDEALADVTDFYRGKKPTANKPTQNMSLAERLSHYVVEGTKEGLLPDLDKALEQYSDPLEIINGPLMDGMAEVGELFDKNQLIVAEVLQSAEVMKAAVAFLEQYMEVKDDSGKGKIILATVKGDVHDIGKNLVDIILSNNGFRVVDLGIKVTPQTLIESIRKEQPDMVGLSGLLVKSAQQMVLTAQDLRQSDISVPILVGGAALSRKFTDHKISPEYEGPVLYAKDAMNGLKLANTLQNEEKRDELIRSIREKQAKRRLLDQDNEASKQRAGGPDKPDRNKTGSARIPSDTGEGIPNREAVQRSETGVAVAVKQKQKDTVQLPEADRTPATFVPAAKDSPVLPDAPLRLDSSAPVLTETTARPEHTEPAPRVESVPGLTPAATSAGQASEREQANEAEQPVRSTVSRDVPVYSPPDYKRHILRDFKLSHLKPYINMQTLLGKHMGLKGKVETLLAEGDEKALHYKQVIDQLLQEGEEQGMIRAHGVYQFFPAQSDGNDIFVYDPQDQKRVLEKFTFPRQPSHPYLCLADFLQPVSSGKMDTVGFLTVTAGEGIRKISGRWKDSGDYVKSHAVQALALELAEGFAEYVHHLMRDRWGFPDPVDMTMQERFSCRYQGVRVSYGYPACPHLEDQAKLFRLLEPEQIGIQLTEGFMMEPEASVSAMVFSHPEGRYFSV